MRAKDIMTRQVITVAPDTPVPDIAKIMAEHGISGVPVVDKNDCLVGMVSEDDLLLKHEKSKVPHRMALFGLWVVPEEALVEAYCKARCEALAEDVMTRNLITFDEEDDTVTIAEVMVRKRVNRVPILSGCHLAGIVTRADLLRAIAGT